MQVRTLEKCTREMVDLNFEGIKVDIYIKQFEPQGQAHCVVILSMVTDRDCKATDAARTLLDRVSWGRNMLELGRSIVETACFGFVYQEAAGEIDRPSDI